MPAGKKTAIGKCFGNTVSEPAAFEEIVRLIEQSRLQAVRAVNTTLIDLYWNVGEYISRKIQSDGWGKGTVQALSLFVQKMQPGIRGFSPQNIWRMRQFFETYRDEPILSTVLRELHPQAADFFKDIYSLELLGLPAEHSEADLHGALLRNLGRFITELGRDFCFIGSEHPIQVGAQDFALDLLFFHRGLNCLVAIEFKVREFRPEDLGKLSFYLEALDRDYRKPHEGPAIGLLLCATKDEEVVEYALSRSLSPAMIAEYETLLPDKALLRAKLYEFYQLCAPIDASAVPDPAPNPKRKKNGPQP